MSAQTAGSGSFSTLTSQTGVSDSIAWSQWQTWSQSASQAFDRIEARNSTFVTANSSLSGSAVTDSGSRTLAPDLLLYLEDIHRRRHGSESERSIMNKTRITHISLVVAAIAAGAIADYLTGSHSVWAPVAVALAADIKKAIGGVS